MAGWIDRIAGALFGDGAKVEPAAPQLDLDTLSRFLPWRAWDKATGLYFNRQSVGFVMELVPLVGADEKVGDILAQWLADGVPDGGCVQILNWASPRVGRRIRGWFLKRYADAGVYETIARHRSDRLMSGVWHSLSALAPFHLRAFRVIVSVGLPGSPGAAGQAELIAVREKLKSSLRTIGVGCEALEPVALIGLVDDLTSPTMATDDDRISYNPYDPIADQAVRRDIEIRVEPHRLSLLTERFRPLSLRGAAHPEIGEVYPDRFDVRHFSVLNFPEMWTPWNTARLIGDPFSDALRLPCPVATVLCLQYPDREAMAAKAGYKRLRTVSLAGEKGSRFLPELGDQAREWQWIHTQLGEGKKLVRAFYGVTLFAPDGQGDACERSIKSLYRACGWDLQDERFIQIQGLLTALPLTLADGLGSDMERFKRFRTLLTANCAAIAPLQGEFLGGPLPHMLLVGRRGEPFFWSPFENRAGNHNACVVGTSGSGKSVFMQELAAALRGGGARVVVIDDGRSFENSCRFQGGEHVAFTLKDRFSLNPFAMVDAAKAADDEDYRLDCIDLLKAMVAQMARYQDRLTDMERGFIDRAVNAEWAANGSAGSITGVAERLLGEDHPASRDLGISLQPFTRAGTYGAFFDGPATVRIDNPFMCFEFAELGTKKELRAVVLVAVMFLVSQMMRSFGRSVPKALIVDEAWAQLQGGAMAEFIEVFARTIRKYYGALVTGTQSVGDFFKSPGAQASFDNSDWMVVLRQKPEALAELKKTGRLSVDDRVEALLLSLKTQEGEYSEAYIRGPETETIGRLVLDPFSVTLYSSSPKVYAAVQQRVAAGLPLAAAIEAVAFPERGPAAPVSAPPAMPSQSASVVALAAE